MGVHPRVSEEGKHDGSAREVTGLLTYLLFSHLAILTLFCNEFSCAPLVGKMFQPLSYRFYRYGFCFQTILDGVLPCVRPAGSAK